MKTSRSNLRLFVVVIIFATSHCTFIENFRGEHSSTESWKELSDTMMKEGKSKSSFVVQETKLFKRAVLFTLLNPQKCGAALAGTTKKVNLDISPYQRILIKCRGQGQYHGYEIYMRHRNQNGVNIHSYVQYFIAPKHFDIVSLEINNFKPYLNGKSLNSNDIEPLDVTNVTTLGILAYGGLNKVQKQRGVASLEIDWIKAE